MGRKSLNKERKDDPAKKLAWVRQLIPYFSEHGLSNFSMDDVARVLEKSKATVYKYFESREEVLQLLMTDKLEAIRKFELLLKDESVPYAERYYKGIQLLSENVADISNLFLADLKKYHPNIWELVVQFQEYAIGVLETYYRSGIEMGVFRRIHPAILTQSDRFFFNLLSDPEFLKDNKLSIQQAFLEYFELTTKGFVLSPP